MEFDKIVSQAKKLIEGLRRCTDEDSAQYEGLYAKSKELLRVYAGPKTEFLMGLDRANSYSFIDDRAPAMAGVLESFVSYIEDGLFTGISPERKAQLDVVSDFLEQAVHLLEDKNVHAAVPAVIIGATLEEYLRNWVEAESLDLGNRKPGIDAYATTLKAAELITKQDVKDITSWAGLRNYAAHGEWEKVESREYVRLVLEGVNLFIRKYSNEKAG